MDQAGAGGDVVSGHRSVVIADLQWSDAGASGSGKFNTPGVDRTLRLSLVGNRLPDRRIYQF